MSDLEPCPFCGGEAELYEADGNEGPYMGCCRSCDASGTVLRDKAEAIAAWNTRADHVPGPTKRIDQTDNMHRMTDRPKCYDMGPWEWRGSMWQGCSQNDPALNLTPGCSGCKNLNKEPEELNK